MANANSPLYNITLPHSRQQVLSADGTFTPPWYKFFEDFFNNVVKFIDLAILMGQIDVLQSLVSQLIAKNNEMDQTLTTLQATLADIEDLKRRLLELENFESLRMTNGALNS